ncbi:MAG: O-antigen ligase family protein [Bacteroidales bacterium]
MPLLHKDQHRQIFIFGVLLLAASVPLSRYFMSVAQLILVGNWLLEGELKRKIRDFYHNKPALIFSSLYAMHFAGLFFTTDFDYAVKDLRTKVPLLILPLIFSTSAALSAHEIKKIFNVYILAVFGGTITGILILSQQSVPDTREMSPFISHIRFSLNVCLSMVILIYLLSEQSKQGHSNIYKWFYSLLFLWFIVYLYISQSFTGYFILGVMFLTALISWSLSVRNVYLRGTIIILISLLPVLLFSYLRGEYLDFFGYNKFSDNEKLVWVTPSAHWYSHDTTNYDVISGHRVWLYVSKEEMRSTWNKRSTIPYDSLSFNSLKIEDVLIRFLTSKGFRKDSTGVCTLNDHEIQYIENGIADVEETRGSPLHKRLRKIFWEYQNYLSTGDPSGHSVMMRLEYWKASVGLIKQWPLTGVGTGDMNQAFNQYYSEHQSRLKPEWRRRSHNQYLSIGVGFGVLGLFWFLWALFYPPLKLLKRTTFVFGYFFLILLLSMLAEDTIESQDGVTFASFFFSLLLFAEPEKDPNFDS